VTDFLLIFFKAIAFGLVGHKPIKKIF